MRRLRSLGRLLLVWAVLQSSGCGTFISMVGRGRTVTGFPPTAEIKFYPYSGWVTDVYYMKNGEWWLVLDLFFSGLFDSLLLPISIPWYVLWRFIL